MDTSRAAAIAVAFDLPEPVGPPEFVARGSMGQLWRLRTADGRSWAVKVLFDWGLPDPSGRDVELQEAAAATGISLPSARRAPDGRVVVEGVRAYEWVDLVPLASPPDAASLDEAGRILGALHGLALCPHPDEDVDEWYRTAPSAAELADLAARADAAQRPWAHALHQRLDSLTELAGFVGSAPPRADDVIVCHRDFTSDNVFRPMGGGSLVVVDWENAGPLSAEAELAITVAAWCASTSDAEVLLAGYDAGGGTASIAGPASFASNAATRLNYLRVMADQSLEDDEHRGFADAAVDRLLRVEMDAAVPRGWWS